MIYEHAAKTVLKSVTPVWKSYIKPLNIAQQMFMKMTVTKQEAIIYVPKLSLRVS